MSATDLSTLKIIRQQIGELLGTDSNELIGRTTVIKEILDSMLFVGLLVRVENYFNIEISDATIYESGLISIGDLVDCIHAQQLIKQKTTAII
ncbi:acyl carrier protein [SAR92 clade bacterium H455]|uniref:Acyl carrier protein n=1 Tax=SAR92 clade bacterium H455 TaxID=2974818 RepID=A0ABY5TPD5_9GAMM|nr:acyl carrier protein [SAR92 clade bacterium H455]